VFHWKFDKTAVDTSSLTARLNVVVGTAVKTLASSAQIVVLDYIYTALMTFME